MPSATIIGGDGFIGRHLYDRLQRDGWSCWKPGRDDPALLERGLGHVFYCAGLTADYSKRTFDTVEAHVSLLNRILAEARFDSLTYLSSTRLYDDLDVAYAEEEMKLSLTPMNPRHLYDLSKALGESLCRVAGHGKARVARLSCVWSQDRDAEGFLPDLLRFAQLPRSSTESCIPVDTSPFIERDYVYIDDVIEALVAIATRGVSHIYNVASGCNVSNAVLLERVGEANGCKFVATRDQKTASLPRISIQRMVQEFCWQPIGVLDRVGQLAQRGLS